MDHFTPLPALLGGALIALAVGGMLLGTGRIAGVAGVLGGALRIERGDFAWRALFVLGLVFGGVIAARWFPASFDTTPSASLGLLALSGALVGVGTRMANGCTSGHGVAGNGRLSLRSIVATSTFVLVGSLTAVVAGQLGRGAL